MSDSVDRLYQAVVAARSGDPETSRTARLMQSGRAKMAKKLVEEAIEVVIDSLEENPEAVIKESADLIYNLVVVWASAGIEPRQVWAEMDQRERSFGIAEKLPKPGIKGLRKALAKTSMHKPSLPKTSLPKPTLPEPVAEPPARRKVVALESRRMRKSR
jgi:phosphoribosyl-ATP pyrophosphohydrolase